MLELKEKYKKEIIPEMMKKFGYKNVMSVPKIEKVVVNSGFGRLVANATRDEQKKICDAVINDLGLITGQRPFAAKAKKSISGFKLREGLPIGAAVTLRGKKMFSFLERLINVALPRTRDFRGINIKSIDGAGNLTLGVKEHIVFPEISQEKIKQIFGFEITIVTTAKNKEQGSELLKLIGFPFK